MAPGERVGLIVLQMSSKKVICLEEGGGGAMQTLYVCVYDCVCPSVDFHS